MTHRTGASVSRRAAVAGLGAGGLGLAIAASGATAQEGTGDLASHPMVGTWAAVTPGGVVPQIHGSDGSFIAAFPPNYVDPMLGLAFQGPGLGRWESDGKRRGLITFLQALSDAAGAYIGTYQVSAAIEVSEDGQTWTGGDPTRVTVRDVANNVVFEDVVSGSPVTATRMGATMASVDLPAATPAAATPTP